jgi:predicted dehydrogenase
VRADFLQDVAEVDLIARVDDELSRITVASRPLPSGGFGYGEKADESAPKRPVENDDVTMFLAAFTNGAIGMIEANRVSAGRSYDLSFTLTGTKGSIRFDQQHMYELQVRLASDSATTKGVRHIQLAHVPYRGARSGLKMGRWPSGNAAVPMVL